MYWCNCRPVEPGFYFLKEDHDIQVVEITKDCFGHGLAVWFIGSEIEQNLNHTRYNECLWQKIQKPE